ncbi:hypothetical protein FI667_g1054, partial [Globisporangium splendens]
MAKAAVAKAPALRRNTKRILAALHASGVAQHTTSLIRESPPLRVLGLDINTNSTGYAVLNERGRVCTWGHIPTAHIQSSDILGIAHAIDATLKGVHSSILADYTKGTQSNGERHLHWHVGIEDFMRMYRFGRFHNKGIFQLAQLNGIVSYTCWQRFHCPPPVHTHPSAARAFFNIAATKKTKSSARGSETDIKEQVMGFVQQQEPHFFLPPTTSEDDAKDVCRDCQTSIFAKNRNGNFSEAAFDVADAYVIAAFTRWKHFEAKLLEHPELIDTFSETYMQMAMAHAEGKTTKKSAKPNAEERALLEMNAKAKQTYLQSLFAHGIEEWIKTSHMQLFGSTQS